MNTYRELLIGCGHSRDKRVLPPQVFRTRPNVEAHKFVELHTLDRCADVQPDFIWDLETLGRQSLPAWNFTIGSGGDWDEIHAYEVLEHLGRQGYVEDFFCHFRGLWTALKPDGLLCATTPVYNGLWAWSDPGHRRIISAGSLLFLDRRNYSAVGKNAMSDYREYLGNMSFYCLRAKTVGEQFEFILRAEK